MVYDLSGTLALLSLYPHCTLSTVHKGAFAQVEKRQKLSELKEFSQARLCLTQVVGLAMDFRDSVGAPSHLAVFNAGKPQELPSHS